MGSKVFPSATFEAALAAVRRYGEEALAIVPHEPDEAMVRAGLQAADHRVDDAVVRAVWQAMIEHAPDLGSSGSQTTH